MLGGCESMAFDEGLAQRVREFMSLDGDVSERKMFGGLCFLCNGNMALGIVGDELMVRVGAPAWTEALREPHTREMDFTGRSMKGMVFVTPPGLSDDDELRQWIERATSFARTLPPR